MLARYGLKPRATDGVIVGIDTHTRWRFAYPTYQVEPANLAADTSVYAYGIYRRLSSLFLIQGAK